MYKKQFFSSTEKKNMFNQLQNAINVFMESFEDSINIIITKGYSWKLYAPKANMYTLDKIKN